MLDVLAVRPLHLHSLSSLLADLVSGRSVGLDKDVKRTFALESVEARALLDWYRTNKGAWSKNVTGEVMSALVNAATQTPSYLKASAAVAPKPQTFVPKRIEIHRFGGVQEYGSNETLVIDLDKPLLLLEGHNGCGKTSILNAVVWCLTGKLYRAQTAPADGLEIMPLMMRDTNTAPDEDDETADDAIIASTLVCPVPPKTVLERLAGKPLPLDTWVAMTFVETGSRREITVRRRLLRKDARKSSKPQIEETGFEELHLDPVAFEVGTAMPGLLPHIRIGTESDLGKAIAELTGLAPLRLMVKHARKVKERIEKDRIGKELYGAIAEADDRFHTARAELGTLIAEHPKVAPGDAATVKPTAADAAARLAAIATDIQQRQASAYADVRAVLGESFDPQSSATRQRLDTDVVLAQAALAFPAIAALSGAATLNGLGKISDEQLEACEAAVAAVRAEARELRALAAAPARECRMRLYVRVANWLRETGHATAPNTCPVCLQPYDGRLDPATGLPPHDHLANALSDGKAHLEKTLAAWAQSIFGTLAHDLPETLKTAMGADLPATPAGLLRAALTGELFETDAFKGVLAPLKAHAVMLCDTHLESLPPFTEPPADTALADEPAFAMLDKALRRLDRALAFARWRRAAQADCTTAFFAIVGRPQEARTAALLHEQPLCCAGRWRHWPTSSAPPPHRAPHCATLRPCGVNWERVWPRKRRLRAPARRRSIWPISSPSATLCMTSWTRCVATSTNRRPCGWTGSTVPPPPARRRTRAARWWIPLARWT
jgi:hypothetical protein